MTDTAEFADIVLPATTQLEQFDIMFSWGHFYFSLNQQAIQPLGEAVPNTELFRRLAERMGLEDECFRMSDEAMALEAMDWSAPALQGITLEGLKEKGWARLNVADPDTFAPHAEGNFPTPSGKCEFYASAAAGGNFVLPLFRQGSNEGQPGGHVPPLPTYVPPRESPDHNPEQASHYPLSLISPKSHAFLNSSYANLDTQRRVAGEPGIVVHPDDALSRGIKDGDPVRVFNERGSFEVVARVSDEIRCGVVMANVGHWRKFSRASATVAAVNSVRFGDLGNCPTFSDTLVQVEPA